MMRDLIVKIKTEDDETGTEGMDSARSAIASEGSRLVVSGADGKEDVVESPPAAVSEDSDSDSTTTSGSFWPDLEVLDPDHPVLERFQANLGRLLDQEDRQLSLKLIELEEKRKCVMRERKRLNGGLEELKRCEDKSRIALQKEKDVLESERTKQAELHGRLADKKSRLQEELDGLKRVQEEADDVDRQVQTGRQQLMEIKRRLEQQQLQLAVARGQLDQGQRDRDSDQANKLFQDLIINELVSDIESAEWRRDQADTALLEEEQLVAELRDAIRSAYAEIAAINAEKIRLNQSWQSSLIVLQRSHETLANTRQSIRDEEARREEIFRCWTLAEREAADLSSKRCTVQLELGRLERRTAEQESQFETGQSVKLQQDQRNRRVRSMIQAREQELESLIKQTELMTRSEIDLLTRLETARTKRKNLESALVNQVFENFACDQEGQAIYRHIQSTEEASRQLDSQMAGVESRNGRLMLDLEQLERDLMAQNRLLEEKEFLVKEKDNQQLKLDQDLAERRKLLERKESQLSKCRSTLEELLATSLELNKFRSEEERALKSLQDQLNQCRTETESIHRQWSDAEQSLISVAMIRDQQAVQEEKSRQEIGVWEEKKKRLLQQVAKSQQSVKQINRSLNSWRETLQSLDTKLASTCANKEELERWNLLSQSQWQLHLEEPEREVHRLSSQLEQLHWQKSNLEISLCDLAKVAVLWSCKLAEIREAQNYVQAERSDAGSLALLQAEKHRLEVQEVQLKKEQEMLNYQLEKAVLGRSGLNDKADLKTGVGHKTRTIRQPVDTSSWYKLLSKTNNQRNKEIKTIRRSIDSRREEADRLETERQSLRTLLQTERERCEIFERQISQTAVAKRQAVAELAAHQKWWRFYEQLRRGTYRRRYLDDSLSELEARANQRLASLAEVATRLAQDFPQLTAKLTDVRASLNF